MCSAEVEVVCPIQATWPRLHPFHVTEALEEIPLGGDASVFSVVRRHRFSWQEAKKDSEHRPKRLRQPVCVCVCVCEWVNVCVNG